MQEPQNTAFRVRRRMVMTPRIIARGCGESGAGCGSGRCRSHQREGRARSRRPPPIRRRRRVRRANRARSSRRSRGGGRAAEDQRAHQRRDQLADPAAGAPAGDEAGSEENHQRAGQSRARFPSMRRRLARLSHQSGPSRGAIHDDRSDDTDECANHKILAIEDDPEVLALYKSYLQKRGYEVLSATGAIEGMSLLQRNPDTRLILLDLNLPGGMSGEEWIAWYLAQGKQDAGRRRLRQRRHPDDHEGQQPHRRADEAVSHGRAAGADRSAARRRLARSGERGQEDALRCSGLVD